MKIKQDNFIGNLLFYHPPRFIVYFADKSQSCKSPQNEWTTYWHESLSILVLLAKELCFLNCRHRKFHPFYTLQKNANVVQLQYYCLCIILFLSIIFIIFINIIFTNYIIFITILFLLIYINILY